MVEEGEEVNEGRAMDLVVDLELLLDTGEKYVSHGLKAHAKELVDGETLILEPFHAPERMAVMGATVLQNGVTLGAWRGLFSKITMMKDDLLELTFTIKIEYHRSVDVPDDSQGSARG